MRANEVINILSKFRHVDKYESFHEIMPSVVSAPAEQKNIVSEILDRCCNELLFFFRENKKPAKQLLKQSLIDCMDTLAIANIDTENREFGYQLGWYLAEKVNVDLRKGTEKKIWGYWQIEGNEVKAPVKPRISKKVKDQQKPGSKKRSQKEATSSEMIV